MEKGSLLPGGAPPAGLVWSDLDIPAYMAGARSAEAKIQADQSRKPKLLIIDEVDGATEKENFGALD